MTDFRFSNVEKYYYVYLAHENLLDILWHGIVINIQGCQHNPRNGHLRTKISTKTIAIV